eukprot:1240447-Rhodomonas_salina.4
MQLAAIAVQFALGRRLLGFDRAAYQLYSRHMPGLSEDIRKKTWEDHTRGECRATHSVLARVCARGDATFEHENASLETAAWYRPPPSVRADQYGVRPSRWVSDLLKRCDNAPVVVVGQLTLYWVQHDQLLDLVPAHPITVVLAGSDSSRPDQSVPALSS